MADKDFRVKNKLHVNGLSNNSGVIIATNNALDSHTLVPTQYGGTGTTQSPTAGQVLYSSAGSTYTPTTLTSLDVKGATYSADAPSNPVVGQVWIESDSSSDSFDPNIIRRKTITATAGQTTFTTDLEFIQGYEQVYFNGMLLLRTSDYTTPSNTSVVLTAAAAAGDIVEILSITNLNSINTATTTTNTFTDSQIIQKSTGHSLAIDHTSTSGYSSIQFKENGSSKGYLAHFGSGTAEEKIQLWNESSTPLVFGTNNAERMRIDSSGNISVGTTLSLARLNVGKAGSTGNSIASYYEPTSYPNMRGYIEHTGQSGGLRVVSQGANLGADASGAISFWTSTTNSANTSTDASLAERMRINASGDVNIGGLSNPGDTLRYFDVYNTHSGNSAGSILRLITNNALNTAVTSADIVKYRTGGLVIANNDGTILFNTLGSEKMKISSDGYIVVGGYNQDLGVGGTWGKFGSRTDANNIAAAKFYASASDYYSQVVSAGVTRANNTGFVYYAAVSSSAGTSDTDWYVRGDGGVFSDSSTSMSTPADYAEYFEWADGNPNNEDRAGYSVSLINGTQIKIAEEGELVIGIVSANPAVVGDAAWNNWTGKYQKDEFNRYIRDENGDRILSESFNPESTYVPREERPEWSPVGMVGKLRMRKGQLTDSRWIKMRDISAEVEEWLVR